MYHKNHLLGERKHAKLGENGPLEFTAVFNYFFTMYFGLFLCFNVLSVVTNLLQRYLNNNTVPKRHSFLLIIKISISFHYYTYFFISDVP